MIPPRIRCLVLACGNTLRGDDGAGPWLAHWAEQQFPADPALCIVSRHQWTPDLAQDIARAQSVLFVDSSVAVPPGSVQLVPVAPAAGQSALATHHLGAPELLALANELYAALPRAAFMLTVGAATTALGEEFSQPVKSALPAACALLEATIRDLLAGRVPRPSISGRSEPA